MSNRTKIVIATVIWITVGYLVWRSFATVLPQYGFFSKPSGRMTQAEWAELYRETEMQAKSFLDSTNRPTRVDAKPARERSSFSYDGWRSDDERQLVFARNVSLRRLVSRLAGVPARRVLEPTGSNATWDLEAILPKGPQDGVKALVRKIKWQADWYELPEKSFVFRSSPSSSGNTTNRPQEDRNSFSSRRLEDAVAGFQNRLQVTARVDRNIRNRRPLQVAGPTQTGMSAQQVAEEMARQYGVEVKTSIQMTTHILLYPSGSKTGGQMDEWVHSISQKANAP
jgi:hypothetical protein